jgi:hypothetical protein
MVRTFLLIAVLCLAGGCASEGQPRWFDAAWKDACGENMKMRGLGSFPDAGQHEMRPPSEDY